MRHHDAFFDEMSSKYRPKATLRPEHRSVPDTSSIPERNLIMYDRKNLNKFSTYAELDQKRGRECSVSILVVLAIRCWG